MQQKVVVFHGGSLMARSIKSVRTEASLTERFTVASRLSQVRLSKADVIRAMHERVQLCQDPQTECALLRESLGVSRFNHILRVHGHNPGGTQCCNGL